MPTDLPPFDPATTKPNSTINPPERSPMVPTWDPTADNKDAALVRIDAANLPGGEYSSDGADDSNPVKLEAMAAPAFWPSDKLDGGGQS